MANTAKPIRKAAKTAVAATKQEMKKPSVTAKGSPLQTKSEKSFMKTYKSDKKGYVAKQINKTASKGK